MFKGTHVNLDEVTVDRARTITVESPGINAYADGDYVLPAAGRDLRGAESFDDLRPGLGFQGIRAGLQDRAEAPRQKPGGQRIHDPASAA